MSSYQRDNYFDIIMPPINVENLSCRVHIYQKEQRGRVA